jgi:hypothetical protein
MARPPAGPIGNSPRDVRDDAVGVPADPINAPEPMRWPPKLKKITKNDFHAKVSGGKAPKRADRAPHFRKGGWVSGYAAGGNVQKKREELPSENKNDPFAKQNLKGGGGVKKKLADGGGLRSEMTGAEKARRTLQRTPPVSVMEDVIGRLDAGKGQSNAVRDAVRGGAADTIKGSGYELENKGYKGYDFKKRGGGVKKRADGGEIETPNKPPVMPDKPFEHTGSDEGGPGLAEENTAQKLARGWNTVNRSLGRPLQTGAASVQKYSDMSRAQKVSDEVPRRGLAGPGYKDGGKLSAAQRQSLPKSDFALPGAGKGPKGAGSGSYPINNPSHAKNALARSSGKPEAAEVRAKVKAKYPGIGQN